MPDKVTITKSKLDSLANTIAAKTGDPLPLTINQMKSAIYNLEIGGGGGEEGEGGDEDMIVPTVSYDEQNDSYTCDMDLNDVASAIQNKKCICVKFVTYYEDGEEEAIVLYLTETYDYTNGQQNSYYEFHGFNQGHTLAYIITFTDPSDEDNPRFGLFATYSTGYIFGDSSSLYISGSLLFNSLTAKAFVTPPYLLLDISGNVLNKHLCIFKKSEAVDSGSDTYYLITFYNIATGADITYKFYNNDDQPTVVTT